MSMLGCNRGRREEDENPKTMPLVKLTQELDPKILAYYLEQVAIYLRNNKKDLWFPLIAPNLDAFLVRVIQDSNNLKNLLHVFDERCTELATEIIDSLEANKHVFTVVYSYVNSSTNKNILVYRKMIETKLKESSVINQLERLCPVKQPTPPEDTTVARKPLDAVKRDAIPVPFKIQWIDATLRFVQDTTIDCLEYPDMTIEQSEFVYSLIRMKKTDNDSDPNIQSSYIPLKEALKEFNVNFEFKATFTYLNNDRVRLTLEKLPLNNNKSEAKQASEPAETVSNAIDVDNLTKAQKNLARKTNMIKQLEPSFIRTALQMILDFMHEDTEASIVFRNANEEQCQFLQSALAMAKARKLHASFDEDSRNLLRKIAKHLVTCQYFDLKIDVAKIEKDTELRTVSLIKTPKEEYRVYDNKSSPTPTTSRHHTHSYNIDNEKIVPSPQREYPVPTERASDKLKAINIKYTAKKTYVKDARLARKDPTIDNTEAETAFACHSSEIQNIDNDNVEYENKMSMKDYTKVDKSISTEISTIDKDREKEKSIIDNIKSNTVNFKNILKETTDMVQTANKAMETQVKAMRDQSTGRMGLRKSRLIEGLTTPLESDVASRMMRQMGWEGGPLGARGDGLMEPVMPAIHLKAGAGLGHVPPKREPKPNPKKPGPHHLPPPFQPQPEPPKPPPKPILSRTIHCHKPSNIRLDLLRHIFALINDEPLERIVVYSTKLAKKEYQFLRNTIQVILRRGALIFNDEEMQALFGRISDEMVARPDLQLGCVMAGDKRWLVFSKNSYPENLKVAITRPNVDLTSIAYKYINGNIISSEITGILGKQLSLQQTLKAAKSLGHKIIVITTVLDLINSENKEKILRFDYPLCSKKVMYIHKMLHAINNRKRWFYSSRFEDILATQILNAVKDDNILYLGALFSYNNQHLTFQKLYQTRSTINATEHKNETSDTTNRVLLKDATKTNKNDKNEAIVNANDKNDAKDTKTADNNLIEQLKSENESFKKELLEENDKADKKNDSPDSSIESVLNEIKKTNLDADDSIDKEDDDPTQNGATCKRSRSDSDESMKTQKKTKINETIKYLGIAPDSYPMEEVGVDDIITFQKKICEKIDGNTDKPLLECLGIKNGAIIYCCHNELGRLLIESVASEMNLKTINITKLYKNRVYKITARMNCYVELDLKNLFNKVEDYNDGLKTDLWVIKSVDVNNGNVTISMEVDEKSFEYISGSKFSIFAGMDKLRFAASWD